MVGSGSLPEGWTPGAERRGRSDEQRRQERQAAALRLWAGALPAAGTIAQLYLAGRGLPDLATSAALRFRADTPHPSSGRYAAMVAVVSDAAGEPAAVHRTFLAANGQKAAVEPVKATLGSLAGGAIRLQGEAPEILVAEGIESAGSAGLLLGLPAWSAVCAGNLAKLHLPDLVRAVVIAADADEPGRKAAEAAAARWRAEGRRVRIARPDEAGRDFNDILCARIEAAHAR
jgi:putative DNA primase/helicase